MFSYTSRGWLSQPPKLLCAVPGNVGRWAIGNAEQQPVNREGPRPAQTYWMTSDKVTELVVVPDVPLRVTG